MPLDPGHHETLFAILEADKRLLKVLESQQQALLYRPDRGTDINQRAGEAIQKCSAVHKRGGATKRELTELEAIATRLGCIK